MWRLKTRRVVSLDPLQNANSSNEAIPSCWRSERQFELKIAWFIFLYFFFFFYECKTVKSENRIKISEPLNGASDATRLFIEPINTSCSFWMAKDSPWAACQKIAFVTRWRLNKNFILKTRILFTSRDVRKTRSLYGAGVKFS